MKQYGMLFGKLYIYYMKVHRGKNEAMWHAVWKVIYLLCERTQRLRCSSVACCFETYISTM